MNKIVIAGAGQAAASAVNKLREEGYEGELTLIGDEPALPYQRPPLSKKYLLGEATKEQLMLRPPEFYQDLNVNVLTGTLVAAIDPAARKVALGSGEQLSYDTLLLTTGATPRQLPYAKDDPLGKVFTIRSLSDIDAVAPLFLQGKRVLIIGGGYIGLEAAAVARLKQLETTLVEAAPRILQRVASPDTSGMFRTLHKERGVDLREDTSIENISVGEGETYKVQLGDGSELVADFIITGIGVAPNIALAEAAGLTIDNGIAVDRFCRTSDANIFAAGDCTSFPWNGERIRLESVPNAIEQGENAALNMLGKQTPYEPVPWFWSDQYDVKLQIAGLNSGYETTIVRDGAREGSKSVWYYREEQLLAVDAFNDAAAFMTAKRLLAGKTSPPPEAVADPEVSVKELLSG